MAYNNKITVLLVCPNEIPKVIKMTNTLKAKQKLVEGLIQVTYLTDDNEVCLICNDEGKINGSLPNRDIGHDIIFGNFLIVGDDYENGDFKSLTDEQVKKYQERFNQESITKTNARLHAIKFIHYLDSKL